MAHRYEMIAATDIGNTRVVNEDSLRILPDLNLAVIADGMGGHKAGDIASRMAVISLCNFYEEQSLLMEEMNDEVASNSLKEAFALANSEVYASSHSLAHCEGMGTTLLAASFNPDAVHIGHIGDSRFYRFSKGNLEQVTADHTLAAELSADYYDMDVPSYTHHVLRRALGIESKCQPDLLVIKPQKDDIYMMCTDGLTGPVNDHDISTILALRSHEPEHCMETLVNLCLENGAPDNISIILIFVR